MAVPLTNSHSVPYHRIDCITVPLTFGIRQDAMLLSPVATDIRFCNLTLYNGLVGLRLNKILQHKEMMFRALRGLRGLGPLRSLRALQNLMSVATGLRSIASCLIPKVKGTAMLYS